MKNDNTPDYMDDLMDDNISYMMNDDMSNMMNDDMSNMMNDDMSNMMNDDMSNMMDDNMPYVMRKKLHDRPKAGQNNQRLSMIVFLILALILIVGEINYIRLYFKSKHVFKQGATVDAVVSDVKYSSSRGGTQHTLYVDYEIDGIKYSHIHYGTDESKSLHVGDPCVAYYDVKNPYYAISDHSVRDYLDSIQNMACIIVFAGVTIWFVNYIKKRGPSKETVEKGLIVITVAIIITIAIVVKNQFH